MFEFVRRVKVQSPIGNLPYILKITCISHFSPRSWSKRGASFFSVLSAFSYFKPITELQLPYMTQTSQRGNTSNGRIPSLPEFCKRRTLTLCSSIYYVPKTCHCAISLPLPSVHFENIVLPSIIPLLSLLGSAFSIAINISLKYSEFWGGLFNLTRLWQKENDDANNNNS